MKWICTSVLLITVLPNVLPVKILPSIINVHMYGIEILLKSIKRPTNLIVDNNNNLYFSFDSVFNGTIYHLAKYNLKTNEFTLISELHDGRNIAFNKYRNVLYFSTYNAIYVLRNNVLEHFIKVDNIHKLAIINDNLVLVDIFGDVSIVSGDELLRIEFLKGVLAIVEDNRGDIIFANDTGLYEKRLYWTQPIKYFFTSGSSVRQISVDSYNNVYVASKYGYFKLNRNNMTATKLERFLDVYGLAFDVNNNPLLGVDKGVVRLYKIYNYK